MTLKRNQKCFQVKLWHYIDCKVHFYFRDVKMWKKNGHTYFNSSEICTLSSYRFSPIDTLSLLWSSSLKVIALVTFIMPVYCWRESCAEYRACTVIGQTQYHIGSSLDWLPSRSSVQLSPWSPFTISLGSPWLFFFFKLCCTSCIFSFLIYTLVMMEYILK